MFKSDYAQAFEKYRNDKERIQKWLDIFQPAFRSISRDVIVDCGCGVGRFAVPLSQMFNQAFGIDNNSKMLKIAREKSDKVLWIKADVNNIPLQDNCADAVLASMLIEHLADPTAFFFEVGRLVKKKAFFF